MKNMAPASATYSLQSRGTPTMMVDHPVRVRRVSIKVAENKNVEAIQVQLAAKVVIEAFQPVINELVMILTWN